MNPWTSSGSSRSEMAVKPDTSTKMTVTCLRSPSREALEVRIFSARWRGVYASGAANFDGASLRGARSGAPHPPQNWSVGSLANPHAAHATASGAPHFVQKRRPSRFSVRQPGHCTAGSYRRTPWMTMPGKTSSPAPVQRKVLTPNDFSSLAALKDRLLQFQVRYAQGPSPFSGPSRAATSLGCSPNSRAGHSVQRHENTSP